ncbi:MAG: hypothetical protein M3066_15625 [Actinomycetota bacterium]|nr:hypothetical protein [Actinomycetota bacterium]
MNVDADAPIVTTRSSTEPRSSGGRPALSWAGIRPIERVCCLVGAALVVSGLFHLGVFAVRGGPWDGPVSWRKPTTFGISFGLTLIAVTRVTTYLILGPRARAWLLGVLATDCVVEVTGITVQAWRHVPSHFNTETPVDTVVAMSLALGGAVLIATLGALAVTAIRGRVHATRDMRMALQAGFVLLLLGLATGVAMIARGEKLVKSGHLQAAYHSAGSLKWVHGVTLHAILVLPALATVLAYLGWDEDRRARAVAGATGLYVMATIAVLAVSLLR